MVDISPICVKIGRVSVVEQIFSSNKRFITAIQVERAIINLTSPQVHVSLTRGGGYAMLCVNLVWHDGRHLAGYWQLCRPDVSRGALCSFFGNLKVRRRNLRWAMSIKSDDANFLTITCVRICLKMNQQSSRQRRSVPRWRTQLRRQILKQRWEDWLLLPSISLTHFCAQELPEIELVPIVSTTKEYSSVEDQVMETNSMAAVRG